LNKGLIRRAAILAGVTAVAAGPALPQDEDEYGSFRQRLRVEQNFGVGDNLGLANPSEGRTSLATTRLTYGLQSETAIQQISLTVGAGLRFGNIAEGNNMKTGFVDPLIGLRYNREGANAVFSFDAEYRQTDISLQQPLWSFLDQDGIVILPADFSNIRGSGERRAYNVGLGLETGLQDPFGLRFNASAYGVDYIDATDPDLTDYDGSNVNLTALFRFNQLTAATLYLGYNDYSSADQFNTDRETKTVQAGFERQISSISRFTFSAGQSTITTMQTNPVTGARFETETRGPSGNIGYMTGMPNGTFATDLNVSQNQDGQRGTLLFTRALQLPTGSLSANIGVTQLEQIDPQLVGGINWVHQMPTSTFTLQLNRNVFTDSEDQERFTNYLVAGYAHEINDISSITADLSLSYTEATDFEEATTRGDLVIAYNHDLTADWSFNTGVAFRTFEDDTTGEADATALFFGIGRNFDLSR
jgi:hypothetical protein